MSVVMLTHNRHELIGKQIGKLRNIVSDSCEVILVDNGSEPPISLPTEKNSDLIRLVRLENNKGAVGRNYGIAEAKGKIVITIDDDIFGIDQLFIEKTKEILKDNSIGGVCFKVRDHKKGEICNWCHHRSTEIWSERSFETYEISEGAVAFRNECLQKTGLYPEEFFISHEGLDLACRILKFGYKIIYSPDLEVIHSHAEQGRPSWRRYYYDTRNQIWVFTRNFPLKCTPKRLFLPLVAMLIYSIRDGFFKYWCRGVLDGIIGVKKEIKNRDPINDKVLITIRNIDKYSPSYLAMVQKRLFKRGVSI